MEIWSTGKLKEFADVKGGKRLPKGKQLIKEANSHPYIRIRDLGKAKVLELTSEYEYVDDETQKAIARYIVGEGDILISVVGTIGLIGIVGRTLHQANQTENCDKIINVRGIEKEYLYYYLISDAGQDEIKRGTVGAVQPKLPLKNVQDITVRYPSIGTQKKIVDILASIDNKIMVNEKINRNLQEQAFAMFDQMMVTYNSENFCELSEIADINPRRSIAKNAEARCIDMAKLSTTGAFPDGWEYKPYTGGMKFVNGDTIMARITPCLENGKTAFIDFLENGETAFGSTEYIVLAPRGNMPAEFLYCLARYKPFVEYAVKNMNGTSGRQRVSGEAIGQYTIPRFSDDELIAFGEFAILPFKTMRKNSIENMKLASMRDALLPKLMSGELDVSDIDL